MILLTPGIVEKKYFDSAISSTTVATVGVVADTFNIIAQGTTPVTRIGRKVTVTDINFHGAIILPSNVNMDRCDDQYRLIWLIDKQCNGTAPAVTDYLLTADIDSFRNMATLDRFHVLKDKTYAINANAAIAGPVTGSVTHVVKLNKKVAVDIEWDAANTNGALTGMRSHNICAIFISRTGTTTGMTINGIMRVKFMDC